MTDAEVGRRIEVAVTERRRWMDRGYPRPPTDWLADVLPGPRYVEPRCPAAGARRHVAGARRRRDVDPSSLRQRVLRAAQGLPAGIRSRDIAAAMGLGEEWITRVGRALAELRGVGKLAARPRARRGGAR